MGGSSNTSTTKMKNDPWGPSQEYFLKGLGRLDNAFLSGNLAPAGYGGDRVANPSGATRQSQESIMWNAANGAPVVRRAGGTLLDMMRGGGDAADLMDSYGESGERAGRRLDRFSNANWQNKQLRAAQNNALGAAVPAAVSQFAGSGMANSSQAMDTVGRAASEATAPFAYDAMNRAQDRSLSASGMQRNLGFNAADTGMTNAMRGVAMAPQIDAAGYLPGHMMREVGVQQDAQRQAEIDARMGSYYEDANRPRDALGVYTNTLLGLGGQGGTQTGSQTAPGVGMGAKIGSAGLGGLGTYGALAMNPATAPFAMMGGLGAGLLGLF